MRWRTLLIAALVGAAAVAPAAEAQQGQNNPGGFSVRPSERAPQDKLGTYLKLKVKRGTERRQSVVVKNMSDAPKELLIDVVDGLTAVTSGSVYANRDDPKKRAAKWIEVPEERITVPAKGTVRVPFSLNVPKDARPGDHLAGIAVQDVDESQGGTKANGGAQLKVTQIVRVVMGVQITVLGPRKKGFRLGEVKLKAIPGTEVPSVVIEMQNMGTQLCKPVLDVALTGEDGVQQTASQKLETLLPGFTIEYPLPWQKALEEGSYDVVVQAKHCGDPEMVQTTAELGETLLGTPDNPEPPESAKASEGVPLPVMIGALVGVALLSAGSVAFFSRRRSREP